MLFTAEASCSKEFLSVQILDQDVCILDLYQSLF